MKIALALSALVTFLALAFLAQAALSDVKPIQLLHVPHFALAPATVRVQVRIRPIASDRCVVVVADNGEFYRRSDWSIDGDSAPKLSPPLELRDIPEGHYLIAAGIGSDRETCERVRAKDEVQLTVIGRDGQSETGR